MSGKPQASDPQSRRYEIGWEEARVLKTLGSCQIADLGLQALSANLTWTSPAPARCKSKQKPALSSTGGSTPIFTIMPYAGQSGPQSITKHFVKVQFSATRGTLQNVVGCGADVTEREW